MSVASLPFTHPPPQPDSLWEQALERLPESDKALINTQNLTKPEILEEILRVADAKKTACLGKRWKYKQGNQDVFIRDKLEKISNWIQRFKAVGSTLVQYDPAHAALPWAGVLFILQITTGDVQVFGAMVDGAEQIAHIVPRCAVLEDIYLRDASSHARSQLDQALLKLYLSILRYLVKVLKFFDKSTARRALVAALGTPEVDVQRQLDIVAKKMADVDSWAAVVQSETNLATESVAQSILHLLEQLQQPIIRSAEQLAELQTRIGVEERRRILQWLSPTQQHRHHRLEMEGHLTGSGSWIFDHRHFREWRDSSSSAILWLHGIPGCGKTKLMHSTIQRLLEEHESGAEGNAAPVAYFYCARNTAEPERGSPEEVVRCLLRQMTITATGSLRHLIVQAFHDREQMAAMNGSDLDRLSLSETKMLILQILDSSPATILIDALDECDPTRRHLLIGVLNDILRNAGSVVKIMVSSRDEGDLSFHFEGVANLYVDASDTRQDIERYIDASLADAVAAGRLLNGRISAQLQEELSTTLKAGAQGMFRWVTMQIDNLCDGRRVKTESDIRHEAGRLPRTLHDAYSRSYAAVLDLARPSRLIAERIFKWLLCAQRLLKTDELAAAAIFASEPHTLDARSILDICSNMVVMDGLGFFRFAHLSVREYLESLPTYTADECHGFVLQRCLESYLEVTADWQVWPPSNLDATVKPYAMFYWPVHTQQISSPAGNQAVWLVVTDFLFGRDSPLVQHPHLDEPVGNHGKRPATTALADWLSDVWSASQYSAGLDCDTGLLQRLGSIPSPSSSPLFLACAFDLVWVLEVMAANGQYDWGGSLRNNRNESYAQVAVESRSLKTLKWLLETPSTCLEPNDLTHCFEIAVDNKDLDATQLLLTSRLNGFGMVDDRSPKETPIYQATVAGRPDIVGKLLENLDGFEPSPFAESMWTAYQGSREVLFPIFWNTCTMMSEQLYFLVVLSIQKISHWQDEYRAWNPTDTLLLADLLEMLIRFAKNSESPGLNTVYRTYELLGPLFQYLDVSPATLFGLASPGGEGVEDLKRIESLAFEGKDTLADEVYLNLLFLGGAKAAGAVSPESAVDFATDPDSKLLELSILPTFCFRSLGSEFEFSSSSSSSDSGSDDGHNLDAQMEPRIKLCTYLCGRVVKNRGSLHGLDSDGLTMLMVVSAYCTIPAVINLILEHDAEINMRDKDGNSALGYAICTGNRTAVNALLQAGVDLAEDAVAGKHGFASALQLATANCRHSIITDLRKAGAPFRVGFRQIPQEDEDLVVTVPFLPTSSCRLCIAANLANGQDRRDSESGMTQLFHAISTYAADFRMMWMSSNRRLQAAENLDIKNQAIGHIVAQANSTLAKSSSESGLTALHVAICFDDSDLVQALVNSGVDVNAVDNGGFSAMHYAALKSSEGGAFWEGLPLARILDGKANPHQLDSSGRTPLHLACMDYGTRWAKKSTVEMLIGGIQNAGAGSIDSSDVDGNTALHMAVIFSQVEVAEILLQAGANPAIENKRGQTPLSLSKSDYMVSLFDRHANDLESGQSLLVSEEEDRHTEASEAGQQDLGPESLKEARKDTKKRTGWPESDRESNRESGDRDITVGLRHYGAKERQEVDLYGGYGEDQWTVLSGPRHLPLRPLATPYRANS